MSIGILHASGCANYTLECVECLECELFPGSVAKITYLMTECNNVPNNHIINKNAILTEILR